jgi:hypothetical protein
MSVGGGGGFGGGLGTVIGAQIGANDLSAGQTSVNNNAAGVEDQTQPFVNFGQSFLPGTTTAVNDLSGTANDTQGYNQFMSGYTNTPAAQYQLQQADQVQNNSAAATGGLLSGANERALGTINSGIVAQNANTAYNEYLSGNQQQFGQLETALGNMFNAIGVGQTATGQNVSAVSSQNSATSQIAQAQAKNAESKGSGLGSMFSGLGNVKFSF